MGTRRELWADSVAASAFAVGSGALWVAGGRPEPGMTGLWLALLCAVLFRVDFRVGKGHASPVMLAIVPLLVLVPAPVVPLLIGAAQLTARMPNGLARGHRGLRLVLPVADALYVLPAALLLAAAGHPSTLGGEAALAAVACALLFAADLLCWPLSLWAGTGTFPREELRASLWIYTFDAMLVPIGFAIALTTRELALAPVAILPLAALLAFFARERREREAQAATLQAILQHASDLIVICERDGRLRRVMGSAAALLGDADTRGTLFAHVHEDDIPRVRRFLAAAPSEAEFRLRRDNRHVHAVAADLTNDPHVRSLVVTIRDDEVRQALRHRATHDPLTGLANRALLYERVAAADRDVALLYLDLDGFKPVNDRLGHAAGDEVLRIVARRLEHCVRAEDTVARLGGDEFALLVGLGAEDEVSARVHAAFADPFIVGGETLPVGASVGLATGAGDPDALLEAADAAMYAVKHARR